MSQRSLAAARARRTNPEPPSKNNNMRSNSHPTPPNNVQSASGQKSNGLPFSKLSISDAIGLITLRLGKVESYLIETQNDPIQGNITSKPDNTIDNTLLTSLNRRVEELEKQNKLSLDKMSVEINEIRSLIEGLLESKADKLHTDHQFNDVNTKINAFLMISQSENENEIYNSVLENNSVQENEESDLGVSNEVNSEDIEMKVSDEHVEAQKKKGGRRKKIAV